jgi:hypothetical protein
VVRPCACSVLSGGPHAAASGGILRWKSAKWPLAVVAKQPDLTEEIAAMRKRCIAACRTGDVTFKKDSLRRGTTLASRAHAPRCWR